MTKFGFAMQQNRDQLVVLSFQLRIGIDVHNLDGSAEFGSQGRQRHFHVMTQVAVGTADQGQYNGHALEKFIIDRPLMIAKRPDWGTLPILQSEPFCVFSAALTTSSPTSGQTFSIKAWA